MRRGDRRAAPRLEMPWRLSRSRIVEGGNVARRASEKCERTVHALRKNRERRVKKAASVGRKASERDHAFRSVVLRSA
jgi:hypothetical protein